jgi:hypothetical protein
VAVALGLTLVAPFWLLALGPLSVGVLHLLSDVRYLVVRPGYHRRPELLLAVGIPLALATTVGSALAICAAVMGAALMARGPLGRRLGLVAALTPIAWLSAGSSWVFALVLAHLHNVVAVGIWWRWRRRTGKAHWAPLLVIVAAATWLMLGPLPQTATLEASSLARLARIPGLRAAPGWDPAGRLLLLFAFMQAVHYTIWIHLLPDEARPRRTTRSFTASWRALTADFGRLPLFMTLALIVGLAGWATFDLTAAHAGYFRMGAFHIPLEMAVLALWFTEGRPS